MPEQIQPRPFEETIVDAINNIGDTGEPEAEMQCLADLIMVLKTRISYNHDQIMEAWLECRRIHFRLKHIGRGLVTYLEAQKCEAEAEVAKQK